MSYIPDFSRNPKGKFDPRLNFISIKGGTDAYLIEDEWNELQWIQIEQNAKLIRNMTNSGCLQISSQVNTKQPGAFQAHNQLIRNSNGEVIQYADEIASVQELNSFVINPFTAVLNGYIAHIESTKPEGLVVHLSNPFAISKNRQDLVILEFWFKELRPHDAVPAFGGIENDPIGYEMMDHRISIPTTNRVQLQWRIRAIEDDIQEINPHYDNGANRIEYLSIHPQGPRFYELNDYIYQTADFSPYNDPHLFVAGNGQPLVTDTIDGYIYAIPLFEVSRLNMSGYNAVNNTQGAIAWKDVDTISDRLSLDGKFANVIYTDDINDQRYQAFLGTAELDRHYTELTDFNNYVEDANQRINLNIDNIQRLVDENAQLRKDLEFMTMLSL